MPLFPRAGRAYAELVAAPSRHFVRKPKNLSHAEAAAIPLAGLTAWQGLIEGAGLSAGERVLVHGAGGGVGHLAVQIAKAHGAFVIATASPAKHDFVAGLGADLVIDYTVERFEDKAGAVDVVLETTGGETAARSIAILPRGGRFVTIVDRMNLALIEAAKAKGVKFIGVSVEPDYVALGAMAELAERWQLRPHVAATFPLAQAADAHAALAKKPLGKIVLRL